MIENNNTFCILPWIHIHHSPEGHVLPCCISDMSYKHKIENVGTIDEQMNSEFMRELRLNMVAGIKTDICKNCYKSEESGFKSFRQEANEMYKKHMNLVKDTDIDGTIKHFKLRYFDIRFSNVCNFKCRSCNAGYSSQWALEDKQQGILGVEIKENNTHNALHSVLEHIPHMEKAYFAGGEPLVTNEHYVILKAMIDSGRTDIELIYNTNISKLKFKDNDIAELWSNFEKPIGVYASLDHYGMRGEYIRSGTIWNQIETNYKKLLDMSNVQLNITTTVSALNYVSLPKFIMHMYENDLWPQGHWQLNPVFQPTYLSIHSIPQQLKDQGRRNWQDMCEQLKDHIEPEVHEAFSNFPDVVDSEHTWELNKSAFIENTNRLDQIRGEDFELVFPELKEMVA